MSFEICTPLYLDLGHMISNTLADIKISVAITVFAVTYTRGFEQLNLATFVSQNRDFHAVW